MATRWKTLILLLCVLMARYEAARILAYFPTPSISHQVVYRPLTLELVKRGHEVFVITTDPMFPKGKAPANLTEIDVHDISYETWRKNIVISDTKTQMRKFIRAIDRVTEMQLSLPEVKNLIAQSQKFDLLMLESCFPGTIGLTHAFKVPVIQINSFGVTVNQLEPTGMSTHPLVHPTHMQQRVYNLSKWEKVVEIYNYLRYLRIIRETQEESDLMLKRLFGSDIPKLSELRSNFDLLFLNIHPIWGLNRPSPPNVIYLGRLHQKPVKELPEDLKAYLDKSRHGVIYISFGTNVDPTLLPPEIIQKLVNVFSKLPYDILWKWNTDELPGRTKNIRISKWLPQSDLLRHPKVKLFITQGGLQSTDEAITAGVPLIGIPMLIDQWYNAEQYVYHKIGLKLNLKTLSEDDLENAIDTILMNESTYRENVAKLHSIMNDQPETPLQRAVWWTEYVIRHSGARHLRSPSANMPWTQYYELELLTYFLLLLILLLSCIGFVCFYLFTFLKQFQTCLKLKQS